MSILSVSVTFTALGLVAPFLTPVDEPLDLRDPAQVLSAIAPAELDQGPALSELRSPYTHRRGGTTTNEEFTLDVPGYDIGATFSLEDGLTFFSDVDGFAVYDDVDSDSATYVRPMGSGGQVIYAIDSLENVDIARLQIPLDEGASLVSATASRGAMLELEGDVVMLLRTPWAFDAYGAPVPTHYELDGSYLVQVLDVDAQTAFPVVADPGWDYTYKFSVGARTPTSARGTLHNCFNCKFPVDGAPAQFPSPNQLLPLTVPGFNFECRMGIETLIDEPTFVSYDYFFNSTANHIDGAGSGISFTFAFFPGDADYSLVVQAHVMNEFGGYWSPARNAYILGAYSEWSQFANNMYLPW